MKMTDLSDNYKLIIGETSDIKATYRAIVRACESWKTDIEPAFADFPVFSPYRKMYGLMSDPDNRLTVVSPDMALYLLEKEGLINAAA